MVLNHIKHFIPSKDARLHAIIHGCATEGSIVGLATAQVPGDRFLIGGIQIFMIIEIASEFGETLTESAAQALFASAIASVLGPEIVNQGLKYVPGVGNVLNGTVAFSVTETIGWATVNYYRGQGK